MKQGIFEITENTKIAKDVFKMRLAGDTSGITGAGQFVNIKIDGFFLRRPISVCDFNENELLIIYKVVGKGTDRMSGLEAGQKLDLLTGLGNGYDLTVKTDKPVLIGGGVGVPPLYKLAKELKKQGKRSASYSDSIQKRKFSLKRNLKRLPTGCLSARPTEPTA